MGKFKGTKKPWRIADDDPTFSALASDTYHQIKAGRGYHDDEDNAGFGIHGFMSINDANLIAAAPELLEALQIICFYEDIPQGQRDVAEAAIAKALGE